MSSSNLPSGGEGTWGDGIVAITIITVGISAIVVALRTATRTLVSKSFWWDDVTIILAVVGTIIGAALDFVEVHYGFGKHQRYLSAYQLQKFQKYTYGEWIQTFASLMWTKVSICLFLTRIPNSKALIRPLQAGVVILIVSNIILTVLWIVQCRPLIAAWDQSVQGQCFTKGQKQRIILAQAIISAVSDFTFASYPILILWKVQLKLKTKVGICCLMGLGVITGVCCLVRTALNYQAIPEDMTYGGIVNWVWRTFEVQIGIIAACVPTLRPGYKWLCCKLGTAMNAGSHRLQLTESPHARVTEDTTLAFPPKAYSVTTESTECPPLRGQIIKTTRVDVEQDGKPSLEIDLGPDFEVGQSSWIEVLDARQHEAENRV